MGLRTAASLKAATTIQIDRVSGFLRCFEVTVSALPSNAPRFPRRGRYRQRHRAKLVPGTIVVWPSVQKHLPDGDGGDGIVQRNTMPKSRRRRLLLVCLPHTTESQAEVSVRRAGVRGCGARIASRQTD